MHLCNFWGSFTIRLQERSLWLRNVFINNNRLIIIALPSFNEIYTAEKGEGAHCNGHPVRVSNETTLLSSLVAYGIDGHQEDPHITYEEAKTLADIVLSIRNLRTSNSAYDFVLVAKGDYGGCLNKTSKIWDNVAAHIVIEEAGGIYTDFYGKPIDYSNPLTKINDNFTFCTAFPLCMRSYRPSFIRADDPY